MRPCLVLGLVVSGYAGSPCLGQQPELPPNGLDRIRQAGGVIQTDEGGQPVAVDFQATFEVQQALAILKELPDIRKVTLVQCKLGPEAWQHLYHNPHLRELVLVQTPASKVETRMLQMLNPGLHITVLGTRNNPGAQLANQGIWAQTALALIGMLFGLGLLLLGFLRGDHSSFRQTLRVIRAVVLGLFFFGVSFAFLVWAWWRYLRPQG